VVVFRNIKIRPPLGSTVPLLRQERPNARTWHLDAAAGWSRLSRPSRSCQFGRASAPAIPHDVHTMRGERRHRNHVAEGVHVHHGLMMAQVAGARHARACWRASSEGRERAFSDNAAAQFRLIRATDNGAPWCQR
jgi:hypothetical protein